MPRARVTSECFSVCFKDKYIARYFLFNIYSQPGAIVILFSRVVCHKPAQTMKNDISNFHLLFNLV